MKYPVSEISEDHTDPIVTEERLNTFKTFYREGNWLVGTWSKKLKEEEEEKIGCVYALKSVDQICNFF